MDKELELKIKSLKQKTFYNDVVVDEVDTSNEDYLVISGYANKFKDITGTVISDNDGDSVVPSGIDLTRYNKNPIILLNHNRGDIIGKAINTEAKEDGLYMKVHIYKSLNVKAYQAAKLGILKTFSIGFTIEDLTYNEKDDIFYLTKTSLLESSLVSVPCNEDSLVESVEERLGISGKSMKSINLDEAKATVTLEELKENIADLTSKIETLRVEHKDEKTPDEDDNTTTEVPSGTADEEEPEVAPEQEEEVEEPRTLVEEVNSIEIEESNFDELLEVQETLNSKLDTFLNNTLN